MKIDLVTADAALSQAAKGRTLVCFAKEENLVAGEQILARYVKTYHFKLLRVEPTAEAAQTLQLSRYPTYLMYEAGSERFQALGSDKLAEELRKLIR